MNFLRHTVRFLFSVYGFLVFVLVMFLLLPVFLIAFTFPQPRRGNAIFRIAYIWARSLFFLTGIRYEPVYRSRPQREECYIFVTNHISYMDIPMMILATRGFPVRILAKAEMGRIPVFGWIYKTGAVCVKRDNVENRKKSVAKLEDLLRNKISILISPEGTFNMTDKPLKDFFNGAFRIAVEIGEPVLPVIFPDTFDRLNYKSIFSLTPGRCRAVFLTPVYPVKTGGDGYEELKKIVYNRMEREITDLNVNWVSKND